MPGKQLERQLRQAATGIAFALVCYSQFCVPVVEDRYAVSVAIGG